MSLGEITLPRPSASVVPPASPAQAVLSLDGVTRRFPNRDRRGAVFTAVEGLTFDVRPGEFVSIVGPSGCGKSTILNMVAGLDRPSEGQVRLSGEAVTGPSAHVGFMLQKDLLLPWRTILRNVEFGLEARPIARAERRARALRELARCRLTDFADRYPHQLSGGMRQRAALARTLAIEPEIVLLDEPFSALDAQTKLLLQRSFAETIQASGVTTLLITHDLTEAVVMSDRILVMSERPGRIVEEIVVDLPHREDPIARQGLAPAREMIAHLFQSLHLTDRHDV
ncbi:ABC transporter ATP-binding protein [Roseomonas sp. OT10]|uniref:ABC transporter ATP-binding protein n=1 Tax=Roseomonas cutis TaxID=2897332 RepID=UPI001E5CE9A0|nr:ABC transporter ATP-binding protein [Roseomonas sp. OT10]UFN48173.1 ABC transporter ATP-binding protein [Roseomonas sp. OT10]